MQWEIRPNSAQETSNFSLFFCRFIQLWERRSRLNPAQSTPEGYFFLRSALLLGGFWLALRWLLPWLGPLLAVYVLSSVAERPVRLLGRLGLPRGAASGLLFLLLALLLCGGLGAAVWWLTERGLELLERLPLLLPNSLGWTAGLEALWTRLLTGAPPALREPLCRGLAAAADAAGDGLSAAATQLTLAAGRWISALPEGIFITGTVLLAAALLSAGRPAAAAFFRRQLPPRWEARLDTAAEALRTALGSWLKAQMTLLLLNGVLLSVGLCLLGVPGALAWALVTALVDLLPVLGSGAVLLPWSALALLGGRYVLALGLAGLWGGVTLLRGLLEPRLMGRRVGLPPLASLAALYLGFTAAGPVGMILAPLAVLAVKVLHDRGLVQLWR